MSSGGQPSSAHVMSEHPNGSGVRTKVKHVTLGKGDHPLDRRLFAERANENDNGLWLFIDKAMFIGEQAKRWSHLNKDPCLAESVLYVQTDLEQMTFWANNHEDIQRVCDNRPECVIGISPIPSARNPDQWVGMGVVVKSQSQRGVSVPHSWSKFLYRNTKRRNQQFDPDNDDEDSGEDEMGDALAALAKKDGIKVGKRKKTQKPKWKKNKKGQPQYTYSDMTPMKWEQQCLWYMGKTSKRYNRDYAVGGNIANPKHPLNPYNVYSLERFILKCQQAGAHHSFCSLDSYQDPADPKKWRLPEDGKHFYRVRLSEFEPGADGIWSYFFPNVPRQPGRIDGQDRQRKLFLETGGEESIANQLFNKHAKDDAASNEASLAARMQEEIHKAKIELDDGTPDGLARFGKAVHKIRQKGLKEWFAVGWNPDSDVSDSVKAVHDWFNTYLYANGREKKIHRTVPGWSGNLNSFGDKLAQMNLMLDTAYAMKNMQQELMVLLMGAYQVPLKTKMHLHALITGPPTIGKTYIAEVVADVLIPGTSSMIQVQSAKADTDGGCASSNQTLIREECVASLLGINVNGGSGKKLSAADEVANFKSLLTSSVVNIVRMVKDWYTGILFKKKSKTELNAQHVCCTNYSLRDADPNVCSRLYCIACTEKDVEYWRKLRAATKNESVEFKNFKGLVQDYFRLQQALFFMIAGLINCEVLPKVDLETPNIIFQKAMDDANKRGMPGTNNPRNMERLQFVCQSIVILRAIQKLWESDLSPLKDQPFEYDHLLLVAPLLVGEVEDAAQALTLLQNQYESPLQRDLLDIMQKEYFKLDIGVEEEKKALPAPTTNPEPRRANSQRTMQEYRSLPIYPGKCPNDCRDTDPKHTHFIPFTGTLDNRLYAYKPLVATRTFNKKDQKENKGDDVTTDDSSSSSRSGGGDHFRTDGLKRYELTRQIVALFKRQVLFDDVYMILRDFQNTYIPNPDGKGTSPALTFSGDIVMVHKNLFTENKENRNKMLSVIKTVTRHRYSRERTMLLMSMHETTGVFDTVHIPAGDENTPIMKVDNFSFMDKSTRYRLGSMVSALSGVANVDLLGAFSERPFYNADADLDQAKCLIRRQQLGFTDEYVKAMKLFPLDPYEYECALAVATDKYLKSDYPGYLEFIDMKKIERTYTAHSLDERFKHEYQMSSLMESSIGLLMNGKSDGTFEDVEEEYEGDEMDENADGVDGEGEDGEEEDIRELIAERFKNVIQQQQQQQQQAPLALLPPPPSTLVISLEEEEDNQVDEEDVALVDVGTEEDGGEGVDATTTTFVDGCDDDGGADMYVEQEEGVSVA